MNKSGQKRAGTPAFLAAAFTLLLVSLWTPAEVRAQWTTPDASGNINNTNPGNVKVGGGTSAPTAIVHTRGNLSSALTGTVGVTQNSAAVTGTGTAFATELSVGDSVKIGTEVFTVSAISASNSLTLDSNYLGASGSGLTAYRDPRLLAADNGDGVNKLTLDRKGFLGLGTDTPGVKLDVFGASSDVDVKVWSGAVGNYARYSLGRTANEGSLAIAAVNGQFSNIATTGDVVLRNATEDMIIAARNANGAIRFTTGAFDTEKVTISNDGNVGIGTPSPSFRLDVAGQVRSSSGGFVFPDGTVQATASSGTVTGITAGNGLTGGGTSGSLTINVGAGTGLTAAPDSISVNYGSAAGTAVQGNTTLTLTAGAGMSGGGTSTLGSGGTLTLTNSDRGSVQNIFKNVTNAAGVTQFSASSNNDSISFEGTGGTTVSFNAAARRVTIDSSAAAASGWTDGGSTLSATNVAARVGVGTASPDQRLGVQGMLGLYPQAWVAPTARGIFMGHFGTGGSISAYNYPAGSGDPLTLTGSTLDLGVYPNGGGGNRTQGLVVANDGKVGIGTATPGAGLTDPTVRLDVQGSINVSGNINAKYQDVAEWVPSTQKLSPGTVVVLDGERTNHVLASTSAYDTKVAGVVSAEPGVILGVGGDDKLKVATTGRVRVKVDASRGAIKVGDLLVTSGVEGVAMKSVPVDLGGTQLHRPGTIIGKALEPLENGVGEILVLLSLQ